MSCPFNPIQNLLKYSPKQIPPFIHIYPYHFLVYICTTSTAMPRSADFWMHSAPSTRAQLNNIAVALRTVISNYHGHGHRNVCTRDASYSGRASPSRIVGVGKLFRNGMRLPNNHKTIPFYAPILFFVCM